ncbi:MAG: sulfatase [Xenococcaceae cyanobacterium]
MRRRKFLFLSGSSLFTTYGLTACQQKSSTKPNVLFISIDDLNDWVGVLGGNPQAKTPNIDRLAKRGILFNRAYCPIPSCNPSRTAVLTGIPPYLSGVYGNSQPWRVALPDATTIPQLFKQNGYRVFGAGKIYHDTFPEYAGCDEFRPRDEKRIWHKIKGKLGLEKSFGADLWPENHPLSGIPDIGFDDWGSFPVEDRDMQDAKICDWVIAKLKEQHNQPFFLACGFFRPHSPWYLPQKYFQEFPLAQIELPIIKEDDLDDIPPVGLNMVDPFDRYTAIREYDKHRQGVQAYLASIRFVDSLVGRLIDALDASSYANNTIIVLWSDHGWHLGEKLHWSKFTLWEEATRVPLVFVVPKGTSSMPEGSQSNSNCDRPVNLLDIYPTLIDLCGLNPPSEINNISGQSLVPLLKNPSAAWNLPAITTWAGFGNEWIDENQSVHHSVRSERFRYIHYADGSEELYDHQFDPMEWTNVAEQPKYADKKAELAKWLPKNNAPATFK